VTYNQPHTTTDFFVTKQQNTLLQYRPIFTLYRFFFYTVLVHFWAMASPTARILKESFLWGDDVSLMPNPQPGGPVYIFGTLLKTCPAR